MSLIEKIDAEMQTINPSDAWEVKLYKDEFNRALIIAKEIILSEQKEPIGNTEQLTERKEPCHKQVQCRYNETGCGDCEYTHNLNKPLTIGDKIRESNESLAELLSKKFVACQDCDHWRCMSGECKPTILAYLNQPYTES
jgi:hypothetical protein